MQVPAPSSTSSPMVTDPEAVDTRPALRGVGACPAERGAGLFHPRKLRRDEREAVAADDRVGLRHEAGADPHARSDPNPGMDQRAGPDLRLGAQMHLGAEHAARPIRAPGPMTQSGPTETLCAQNRAFIHDRGGMHARPVALPRVQKRRKPRQRIARARRENRGLQPVALPVRAIPHHRGAGAAIRKRGGIIRFHRERERVVGGIRGLGHMGHAQIGPPARRQSECRGNFLDRVGHDAPAGIGLRNGLVGSPRRHNRPFFRVSALAGPQADAGIGQRAPRSADPGHRRRGGSSPCPSPA